MVDPLGQLIPQKGSGLLNKKRKKKKKSTRKAAKTLNYEVAGDFSEEGNGEKEMSWDRKQSIWAA